jgi:hypothetical protein
MTYRIQNLRSYHERQGDIDPHQKAKARIAKLEKRQDSLESRLAVCTFVLAAACTAPLGYLAYQNFDSIKRMVLSMGERINAKDLQESANQMWTQITALFQNASYTGY